MILDLTTPYEYQQILQRLPYEIQDIITPNLQDLDEILFDLGELLSVRLADLRIDYPIRA